MKIIVNFHFVQLDKLCYRQSTGRHATCYIFYVSKCNPEPSLYMDFIKIVGTRPISGKVGDRHF